MGMRSVSIEFSHDIPSLEMIRSRISLRTGVVIRLTKTDQGGIFFSDEFEYPCECLIFDQNTIVVPLEGSDYLTWSIIAAFVDEGGTSSQILPNFIEIPWEKHKWWRKRILR